MSPKLLGCLLPRILSVAVPAIACAVLAGPVAALTIPGECLLKVGGRTYIDGACEIDMEKGGSFMMSGPGKRPVFVMVNIHEDEGNVTANWNGPQREIHAHGQLGTVARSGGCWTNKDARICAWKKGTRPSGMR